VACDAKAQGSQRSVPVPWNAGIKGRYALAQTGSFAYLVGATVKSRWEKVRRASAEDARPAGCYAGRRGTQVNCARGAKLEIASKTHLNRFLKKSQSCDHVPEKTTTDTGFVSVLGRAQQGTG
jgi:hypothetical protein